jgi:hypothetical protein
MLQVQQNGLNSSAGFQGVENSPLGRIGYYSRIIALGWESDFLKEFTNSEIDGRILECNQIVQFTKQPNVGPWRDYEKNQELVPDQVTPEGFCMKICNAKYKALKFDKLDIMRICDRWDAFEESFLDSTYQTLASEWRNFVLCGMALEADSRNKGVSAGRTGDINLGAPGAPVVVNGANFGASIAKLKRALKQRLRWQDGKMVMAISSALSSQLVESPYANALNMGNCVDCSMLITGKIPSQILGFWVYETESLCASMDPFTQTEAYYVIAAHRDAFAFAGDIVEGELVRPSRYFGVEYQMLAVWGAKAILPDAIAVLYATVAAG